MAWTGQPPRPFRALSVNVNGLAASAKRRAFFASLQQQRQGLVLLSETHCTSEEQGQAWVQEGAGPGRPWQGMAVWANQAEQGQQAAGGVGILIAEYLMDMSEEPVVHWQTASGRVLKVSWLAPWGQRLVAMAVYAPCNPDDREDFFLGEVLDAIHTGPTTSMVTGGDFNCAMRVEDVLAATPAQAATSSRLKGGEALKLVVRLEDLHDAWLATHPSAHQPTHYTHQQGGHITGGRIDYVFLSEDLMNEGWLKGAQQHRRFPSDHRAVAVQLQPPGTPQSGPKRWRFPTHMLGVQAFETQLKSKLSEAAQQQRRDSPDLDPAMAWEGLKDSAIAIAKQLQPDLQQQQRDALRLLRQDLAAARNVASHLPSDGTQQTLLDREQDLSAFETARLARHVEATEPLWEVFGETSSYWFHRLGRTAQEQQHIAEVLRPDGSTVAAQGLDGMREVGERLANFYDPATGGLFMRHPTDPAAQQELLSVLDEELGEEEQQRCEGPQGDGTITADEALTALRSLPRGKSPGSDGLTYEFYLAMWEVVGQPLVAAFNYAFSDPQRRLSERQRLGLIILIYKGGGKPRADPASYRPITLLNTDLKIVAKVMVLRFGPALESVIDSTQTAFVPGRDIADNVLLHLEEVDYVQGEQGQQGCILFLDFEKAYDRLDRDWVLRCMETMQFPGSSTRWVRLLLEGTCGQVMFNGGCTSRVFDIPSGCAQGSPLSPLLYVIAAQPLAAMCRTMQAAGEAPGILLPDGSQAPPSHQHADDTTLHGRTVDSVRTLLRRAVLPFCAASGAKLNADKSQGMVLGAHPAMVGVDEETGVTFVDTTVTPIRHLGILLSENGATAFAQQLFEQRLRSITHRVRHWSKLKLSLLGRCEVARQVLASCLVYHAQFVPVPARLMSMLQRRIKAFTLGLGCVSLEDAGPFVCRPAAAVANLPVQRGGIGHVDVQSHVTAMQAKVAAALLHPHRRAWKLFMHGNLDRQVPGGGAQVLIREGPDVPTAAAPVQLGPRHKAYVAAVRELGLCRRLSHGDMTSWQIQREPVVGNHSVADATTGVRLRTPNQIPSQLQEGSAGLLLGSCELTFQAAQDGIVLPLAWQQILQAARQEGAEPTWQLDTQRRWARNGDDWYFLRPDGSLGWMELPPFANMLAGARFEPACVVWAPKGGPKPGVQEQRRRHHGADHEGPASAYYVVGAWREVLVDPTVWHFGPGLDLLHYSVRAATQRLLQFRCRGVKGWVRDCGLRPRTWRDDDGNLSPATALPQLEARQKRSFDDMRREGFGSRNLGRFSAEAAAAGTHALWMDPSPPRLHPLQRAAATQAAAGVVAAQRAAQQLLHVAAPAVDDTEDPLARGTQEAEPADTEWMAAYRRASFKRLPRALRILGWKLLHAAVRYGGSRIYAARSMSDLLACCCHQPQCWPHQQPVEQQQGQQEQEQQQQQQQQPAAPQGQQQPQQQPDPQQQQQQQPAEQPGEQQQTGQYQLESLSHVFVACPGVRGAWDWFGTVWDRVQPGSGVDFRSVRVLLLDDSSVWQPPRELQQLWTHLRLLMLESIWVVRCAAEGRPYSSAQVVARFRVALQQQLKQDWARTQGDIRVDSGVPMSWLRGRSPVILPERFVAKWRPAGLLYTVGADGGVGLSLP